MQRVCMHKARRAPSLQRQCPQGGSLLEVLVALAVLSVGLMGLSTLHWRTVQNSHTVMAQTLATLHAQEAAERLWLHSCWRADQAQAELAQWAQHPPAALPDWQATWTWHTGHAAGVVLEINQQWARAPHPLKLAVTAPALPCPHTP